MLLIGKEVSLTKFCVLVRGLVIDRMRSNQCGEMND